MIIDRLAYFRTGLREVLLGQADLKLIDCDFNEDVLGIIEATTPDVLLLDIDYPSMSGLGLTQKIVRYYPATPVIILSSNPDDEQLFEATKTGAVAFLDKNITVEKLTQIVRRAYRGEYPINDSLLATPKVAERVLRQFRSTVTINKTADDILAPLTPRETQVLTYIAHGNSNKQIANTLRTSEQTIKSHVSSILRKLNANDRAHAVALAIGQRWFSYEEEVTSLT